MPSRSALLVAGVVAGLVLGGEMVAMAATGHPLLLGERNVASAPTVLVRHGHGPALALTTHRDSPPLRVSSWRKVRHLNADRLDGHTAKDLQTRALTFMIPATSFHQSTILATVQVPAGAYLTTVNAVVQSGTATNQECSLSWKDESGDDDRVDAVAPGDPFGDGQEFFNVSAVVTLQKRPGGQLSSVGVRCRKADASSTDTTDWGRGGRITLIPIDDQIITTLPPGNVSPRRAQVGTGH